jgi:alkylhydroperoxidase family enzyme
MRIPYAPSKPTNPTPETQAIYDRIAARRNPRPLIPLDLALLHNPAIADGYNSLLGAIRTQSSFPLALAELAICYIAVLNHAVYEWTAHAPIALKAGVTPSALRAVLAGDILNESVLGEDARLVLEFTRQSTKEVKVEEEVMEDLKFRWSDQQVMELTITVAGYNMVSRFLVALDVTESNGKEMVMPKLDDGKGKV